MPCALPFVPDLELAEAASLAYDDPTFVCQNLSARVVERGGRFIVSWAGSNDGEDWLQNFSAVLVARMGRGKIFNGFADQGDCVKAPFLSFIQAFPGPFEVSTHSAGASPGLQCAAWMAEIGLKVNKVQLLAGPTIWDQVGAAYYRSFKIPTLRIGMYRDPVAALPGPHCGGAYEAPMLVLDDDGHERECQDLPPEWWLPGLVADAAKEHPVGRYIRAVRMFTENA